MRDILLRILLSGALCNTSFSLCPTNWPWEKIGSLSHGRTGNCMTYRRKMRSRSWRNRECHDLQEKNEIQIMGKQERPWPTGGKWNPGHGEPGNAMTYRRKTRSRSWRNREGHDLQEKNEIQVMEKQGMPWSTGGKWNSDHRENGNSMIRRFCLFRRINLYKTNHARRKFTFICKITPRVIFPYLLCSKFLSCIR